MFLVDVAIVSLAPLTGVFLAGAFFAVDLAFALPLITSFLERGLSSGFQIKPVRKTSSFNSGIGVLIPSGSLIVTILAISLSLNRIFIRLLTV
ncbi:hypothetical protein D3C80_1208030 [compost metagenome]